MKKIILLLVFCGLFAEVDAQPGEHLVSKNIDKYTPEEIAQTKLYRMGSFYRFEYIIDSTTDVSKLKNLRPLKELTLVANLRALPKELYYLSDSLQSIVITAGKELTDISSLRQLKNLESVTVKNYAGENFPVLSHMKKLNTLIIEADYYQHDKLKSISAITDCPALKTFELRYNSIGNFDMDMRSLNLETVKILWCRSLKNIDQITRSKSLKKLEIYGTHITKLPDNMANMQSLEEIFLSNMGDLRDISNLRDMKNLRNFSMYIPNTSLREVPQSFNTNSQLKRIRIEVVYGYQLTSAAGLSHLKNLESISIGFAHFLLPDDFNTCQNLKSVEFTGLDPANVSKIHDLPKLKELELSSCSFAEFPPSLLSNKNIESFTMMGNKLLTDLSNIEKFTKLNKMVIVGNDRLAKIPDFKNSIGSFQRIYISGNSNLTLPDTYKAFAKKDVVDVDKTKAN